MTQLLEVKDLSKSYPGFEEGSVKQAVRKVSFAVGKGEIFGLLGPNGAGKTSLLKMLLGLSLPSSGEILLDGTKVSKESLFLRQKLGYLPERVALYPNLTALETLHFFASLRGVEEKNYSEVLAKVGLSEVGNQYTREFSKGMLQRLGLAQAILGTPQLLILDEPTSGLDPEGAIRFKELIRQLNDEGITIVFSSHILTEVEDLADRIGIMVGGQLIASGVLSDLGVESGLKSKLKVQLKFITPACWQELQQAGVSSITEEGNWLTMNCESRDKYKLLQVIESSGAEIIDFSVLEPSLEDVFLKYLALAKGGIRHE